MPPLTKFTTTRWCKHYISFQPKMRPPLLSAIRVIVSMFSCSKGLYLELYCSLAKQLIADRWVSLDGVYSWTHLELIMFRVSKQSDWQVYREGHFYGVLLCTNESIQSATSTLNDIGNSWPAPNTTDSTLAWPRIFSVSSIVSEGTTTGSSLPRTSKT